MKCGSGRLKGRGKRRKLGTPDGEGEAEKARNA